MSKNSSAARKIPSVLSLPDKVSGIVGRLLSLRFPVERQFSGRDILLILAAAILLLVSVLVRPLQKYSMVICLIVVLIAAVPLVYHAYQHIKHKKFPFEEVTWILAGVLAFLLREYRTAALILILSDLLYQTEAYCLLHRDAAPDYLKDSRKKLQHSVELADEEKSSERRIMSSASLAFYLVYVMISLIFAIIALFHGSEYAPWLHRSLVFLLLSAPSAFLFSSMLTHFGAVYSAAKADILFADDNIPEVFSKCRLFAFSKTGTVTDGRFIISEIAPVGITEEELLRIAAVAECRSDHPIALALKATAGLREGVIPEGYSSSEEVPGKGVITIFSGRQIYVGNAALLEEHGIWYQIPSKSGSAVHVAIGNTYKGYVLISDALRDSAFDALEELRAQGVSTLVMLTGDVRSSARVLASSLNFDMVKPELSPEEKGSAIRYLRSVHGDRAHIASVGDGFHDSAMFEASDISVCLEPMEEDIPAKVCIYSDNILRIPLAYRICRETERIFLLNSAVLAAVKILLAILGAASVLSTAAVACADFAVGAAAVIFALTSFTLEKRG